MRFMLLFPLFFCFLANGTESYRLFFAQNRFYSASNKALADAGIALPDNISSGLINPALTFSNHHTKLNSSGTLSGGYGQDSIFNKHIIPVGITYSTDEGTLGLFYRYLKSTDDLLQHEAVINIAGQLFTNSEDQGAVDFGVNLRFEKMTWNNRPSQRSIFFPDDTGKFTIENELQPPSDLPVGYIRDKRVLIDIGFYQPRVWNNIDFGLTLRNIIGYVWSNGNTESVHLDTLQSASGSDSAIVKDISFTGPGESSRGWTNSKDRILSAGIVYHCDLGKIQLNIPIDLEVLGLFDKGMKNRFLFKGGMEAKIGQYIALRFGYSRMPGLVKTTMEEIKNVNVFTGGGGLRISALAVDFYLAQNVFGTTVSFDY